MKAIEEKIAELIEPVIRDLGIALWGIRIIRNPKRTILQIFIDREGGVTVGDCEEVSRQINGVIDVADIFKYSYYLEVSSPGLDRFLFNLDQVRAYLGKSVSLELSLPVENRRRFRGILKNIDGDILEIETDGKLYQIAYPNVSKAQLVPEF